ncbi:putative acetyltransferase [termite gut metagenome]|uniref:Putative acetyltransferase n=1 Tax=termite gut metagenome TaxID=433724 RepID=A0A5J4Q3A3_9ZZZZ
MGFKIIKFFAYLSLFIFPYSMTAYLRKLIAIFLSCRFALLTKKCGKVYLQTPFYVKGHRYIHIGNNFIACPGFRIECWDKYENEVYTPSIVIGDNVCFNFYCHVGAINKIIIGNNVLVGSHVLITDHFHGKTSKDELLIPPSKRKLYSKGSVIIENDVWIGEGVCVLPNLTIGHNSIIGANSVVTHDIPPYSVVAGNPAKILKTIE